MKALGADHFPEESTCQWGPDGPFSSVPGQSLALPSARGRLWVGHQRCCVLPGAALLEADTGPVFPGESGSN